MVLRMVQNMEINEIPQTDRVDEKKYDHLSR